VDGKGEYRLGPGLSDSKQKVKREKGKKNNGEGMEGFREDYALLEISE